MGLIYLIWGSTFMCVRVAVHSLPPFLLAGTRFFAAGVILFLWAYPQGDRKNDPLGPAQLGSAFIIGVALLTFANGAMTWAMQYVPSGVTSLLVAMTPLWMALLDRIFFGQTIKWKVVIGLFLGFAGAALLITERKNVALELRGTLIVLAGTLSWATGSLYSRKAPLPKRPLVASGLELLSGGGVLLAIGFVLGEHHDLDLAATPPIALISLAYLILIGALVGFVCYTWLLRVAPTPLVATYAYVNPVIAVFLGWGFLGEALTPLTLLAGLIIIVAVALIITVQAPSLPARPAAPEQAGDPVAS